MNNFILVLGFMLKKLFDQPARPTYLFIIKIATNGNDKSDC